MHIKIYRCGSLRGKHLVSYFHIACISADLRNISYICTKITKTKTKQISYEEEITKNSRFNRDPWRLWKLSLLSKRNVSICFLLLWSELSLWGFDNLHTGECFFFSFFQSDIYDTFQVVHIPVWLHWTLQEPVEWMHTITDSLSAGTKSMTSGYVSIATYKELGKSLKIPQILHKPLSDKQRDLLYVQRSSTLKDHIQHRFLRISLKCLCDFITF